jgi:hypothetical protein
MTSASSQSGRILSLVFFHFQNKLWFKWNAAKSIDFRVQQNERNIKAGEGGRKGKFFLSSFMTAAKP